MDLLQAFHGAWFHGVQQSTLKECIGLLLALPVNSAVAICKPIKEVVGTIIGIVLGQCLHALGIKCIGKALLTIRSLEFEVVSDTNQLNTVFGHLALQVLPIVAALFIVLFVIDGSHNVSSRESISAVFEFTKTQPSDPCDR